MRRPRVGTVVGLVLVAGAFAALVAISLGSALVYYVTPTELTADARTGGVRLYGVVEPGSVQWATQSSTVSFRVTDGTTTIDVESRAIPTGLFRDGIGVVLAGRLNGSGLFNADEVLVKHSEVYEPLQPGQTLPPGLLETIGEEAP
jgi:cytochrome c-type biogenesis protein CcmE